MSGAIYRRPEDVAPELGLYVTELKRYAVESGCHTRLARNRIAFDDEDVQGLIAWIKENRAGAVPETTEEDVWS